MKTYKNLINTASIVLLSVSLMGSVTKKETNKKINYSSIPELSYKAKEQLMRGRYYEKISHRGIDSLTHNYSENTLSAFNEILYSGFDVIEFDVRKCKTGEVIVIHDGRLERTTDGKGYAHTKKYSYIKKLDAGNGEKIPTLDTTLYSVDARKKIMIDMKGLGIAKPTAEIIKKQVNKGKSEYKDFLVSSLWWEELDYMNKNLPEIQIGVIGNEKHNKNYMKLAEDLRADVLVLNVNSLNDSIITRAHKNEMDIYVWGVKENAKEILDQGIGGIITKNYEVF